MSRGRVLKNHNFGATSLMQVESLALLTPQVAVRVQRTAGTPPASENVFMKILYLHGWHSVPGSVKPTYLTEDGHEVINPALPDEDFAEAVRIALEGIDKHRPLRRSSVQGGEERSP